MDKASIWSRFTQSGSVEDYLSYKGIKKPQYDGEPNYEDEYERTDTP